MTTEYTEHTESADAEFRVFRGPNQSRRCRGGEGVPPFVFFVVPYTDRPQARTSSTNSSGSSAPLGKNAVSRDGSGVPSGAKSATT